MGTWGHGNFENDAAAEVLISIYEQLEGEVAKYANSDLLTEPDEMAALIMANLELIAIIAEGARRTEERTFDSMLFPYRVPAKARLIDWKQRVIRSHIRWMTAFYADDSKRALHDLRGVYSAADDQRLRVIGATFDRLILLADSSPPLDPNGPRAG